MQLTKRSAKLSLLLVIIVMLTACQDKDHATANTGFPAHCVVKQITFTTQNVRLATKLMPPAQQLFLIHNTSQATIWLNHPLGRDPGASAGWGTEIAANHWSAIGLSQANFTLSCQNAQFKPVPCAQVIKICQMTRVKFPKDMQGSFWAAENKPLEALLATIKKRGINY